MLLVYNQPLLLMLPVDVMLRPPLSDEMPLVVDALMPPVVIVEADSEEPRLPDPNRAKNQRLIDNFLARNPTESPVI